MEQQREQPPPYATDAQPALLPSVSPNNHSLSSPRAFSAQAESAANWQNQQSADYKLHTPSPQPPKLSSTPGSGIVLQPLSLPDVPTHAPGSLSQVDRESAAAVVPKKAPSTSSYEDPDDRMAAEALCGLGKVDSNVPRPLSGYETPLNYYPIGISHTQTSSAQQPEPLLSLVTSSHPWLGGTINRSVSAYSSTKSYTPRFIQYGADLVENTVGTVGRKTGVEDSLRRYLAGRQPTTELDRLGAVAVAHDGELRSLKIEDGFPNSALRHEHRKTSHASSTESLPPYDENRSPAYEETSHSPRIPPMLQSRAPVPRSWSSQLMISTSGLGAALSESSLRSLKFCLSILQSANCHLTDLMEALKRVLSDYQRGIFHADLEAGRDDEKDPKAMQIDDRPHDNAEAIANRIRQLNEEIWNTLKNVVNTVSRYTGGALPENASVIVRWQLMSVPQRWRRAVSTANPAQPANSAGSPSRASLAQSTSNEIVSSAHRMLAFAIEGLDMMGQVGGVVDSTIQSAEKWLDSMGRKRNDGARSNASQLTSGAAMSPTSPTEQLSPMDVDEQPPNRAVE